MQISGAAASFFSVTNPTPFPSSFNLFSLPIHLSLSLRIKNLSVSGTQVANQSGAEKVERGGVSGSEGEREL